MKTLIQTLFFFFLITQICFGQWYEQNSGTSKRLNDVHFINQNTGWAVGDSGTILNTTNEGLTWAQQTSGTTIDSNDVQFINESNGWIVGGDIGYVYENILLHTTNGGITWTQQILDTVCLNSVFFINENIGWIGGTSGNLDIPIPIILKTVDGGNNWLLTVISLNRIFNSDIYFINSDIGFTVGGFCNIGGCGGHIHKTTDGGETWIQQAGDCYFQSIGFVDEQKGIAVGYGHDGKNSTPGISYSTDGGINWTKYNENSNWMNSVAYLNNNFAWVVGSLFEPVNILFSGNGGVNWTNQGEFTSTLNDVFFINSSLGWVVGDNGTILHTTNGGVPVELTSFTAISNGDEVIINWTTATETNNAGFEILRFTQNDNVWKLIGYVPGFGTTTEPKSYTFTDSKLSAGKYTYRLKQIDFDGSCEYSQEVEVTAALTFSLDQNYPNPFNPSTVISYQLPVSSNVTLKVYDILGNKAATLVDEYKTAGKYEVEFNTSSHSGNVRNLTSGVYFYQLRAGEYTAVKKMILLK